MIEVYMGLTMVGEVSTIIRLLHYTTLECLQQSMSRLWDLEDLETFATLFLSLKPPGDAVSLLYAQ